MSKTARKLIKKPTHIRFVVFFFFSLQIARSLTKQRYGFVFGVNMFGTLVIETILTVIVVDKAGLSVNIRTQVCSLACKE